MASGKVKWFDNRRGFGFIAQDSGKDLFVHHTSILGKGYKILSEGEKVNFDVVDSARGPKAENVQRGPVGPPKVPAVEMTRARATVKRRNAPHHGRARSSAAGRMSNSRRRTSP